MNQGVMIDWIQENLGYSDIDCRRFIGIAHQYGRAIICGVCEDYPYGIVLVYHNNSDEYELEFFN